MLLSCRQAASLSGRQLHQKEGYSFRHRNVRMRGVGVGGGGGGCGIAMQSEQGMHNGCKDMHMRDTCSQQPPAPPS